MALTYLLDTDWVVDYLQEKPAAIALLQRLRPAGIGISVMTLAELELGVAGARDPKAARRGLDDFLAAADVLGLTQPICRLFAEWSVRLERQGQKLDHFDVLIASTALHHGLTLCTNNRRHFERIMGLSLFSESI
jgi:predicted nucleic acid-binding protein